MFEDLQLRYKETIDPRRGYFCEALFCPTLT